MTPRRADHRPPQTGTASPSAALQGVFSLPPLSPAQAPDGPPSIAHVRRVLAAAGAPTLLLDSTGLVKEANDEAVDAFGWPREQLLGRDIRTLRPPGSREAVSDELRVAAGGLTLPATQLRRDGRTFPAEVGYRALETSAGPLLLATVRDLSHRERIQDALLESEARWRTTLETMIDPVALLEPVAGADGGVTDLRLQFVNAAARRQLAAGGVTGTVLGRMLLEVVPHLAGTDMPARFAEVAATHQPFAVDGQLVRAPSTGRIPDAWWDVRAQWTGQAVCLTWRDVTDRVLADRDLRDREHALEEAQRVGRTGSWAWDASTDAGTMSLEARRIAGLPDEAGTATFADLVRIFAPESVSLIHEAVKQALADRERIELEVELARPGRRGWAIFRAAVDAAPDGSVAGLHGTLTDITDLRTVEHEAHLLLSAIDQSSVGFAIAGLDGTPVYENAGVRRLLGLPDDAQPGLASTERLFPSREAFFAAVGTTLATGRHEVQAATVQPDGRTINVHATASLLRDGSGRPTAIAVTMLDATAEVAAIASREDQRLAQRRTSLIMAASRDIGIVMAWDGTIRDVNDAAVAAYGLGRDELVGTSVLSLCDPADRAAAIARLEAIREQGGLLFETVHLRRDGGGFPVEVSARAVDLDDGPGLVSFIRDITRRKEVEAALRASEAALLEAQRVGRTGSWSYDILTERATWSASVLRIIALDPAPEADPAAFLDRWLGEEEAGRVRALLAEAVTARRETELELAWRRPDGSRAHGLVRLVPDLAPDGTTVGIHGTLTDITALAEAENEAHIFKSAIEQSGVSTALASLEWTNLYANPAARRLFEVGDRDITGLPHVSFIADPPAYARFQAEAARRGFAQAELDAVLPGGRRIPLLATATLIRDRRGDPVLFATTHIDLTAIRDAEAALRSSEAALLEAQRVGRTGSWTFDAAGEGSSWSPEMYRILGIEPVAGQSPFEALEAVRGDGASDGFREGFRRVLALGRASEHEAEVLRGDGKRIWVLQRSEPTVGADGSILGLHGTLTDLTDIREAQREARTLKQAIDQSVSGFVIARLDDGAPMYMNPAIKAMLGLGAGVTADVLPGAGYFSDPEAFGRHLAEIVASGHGHAELQLLRADGGTTDVLSSGSLIRDAAGSPVAIGVAQIDLTTLHAAQAAEREASEQRRRVLASINGIVRYRPHPDAATIVSPQVEELLGWQPHEVAAGQAWRALIHPDDDHAREAIRLDPGESVAAEYRMRHRDGHWVWVRQSTRRMFDAEGSRDGFVSIITDITERKVAEAALSASEERYRTVVAALSEGIILQGADGAILAANESAERILGLGAEELAGRTSSDPCWRAIREDGTAFPGDAHPAMVTLATGEPVHGVIMGVHKPDGTLTWISVSSAPIPDPVTGRPGAVVTSFTDITERKATDLALRESEGRLHGALDAMLDPFVIASAAQGPDGPTGEFHIRFANDAFAALSGFEARAAHGLPITDAMLAVDGHGLVELGTQVMASGTPFRRDAVPYAARSREDAPRTGLMNIQVVRYGDGFFAAWRDVTDLERTRSERERLAAAVEQTVDLVLVTDVDGRITFANAAFLQAVGRPAVAVLGEEASDILPAVVGAAPTAELVAAGRAGQAVRSEYTRVAEDGTTFHYELVLTPIPEPGGDVSSHVIVTRDRTRLRVAERELLLEADLRRVLATALQRAPGAPGPERAADTLCEAVTQIDGVDFAAVYAFLGEGHEVVAWRGARPTGSDAHDGQMHRLMHERGAPGPFAVSWDAAGDEGRSESTLSAIGIIAAAFGPIVHGDHVDGMLVVGTSNRQLAATLLARMPEIGDFSNTPSALLAAPLHAVREAWEIRTSVGRVIAVDAYDVHFQPIVDLASGTVVGYEALTRFHAGGRADATFESAWSVGLGGELELATIRAAVRLARSLPHGRWLDLKISPRLLEDGDRLRAVLAEADRPLVLEVTEHEQIADYADVRTRVGSISREVRLAVDDAGAGAANFNHIVELRADFVKLDIGIVRGINANFARQALVLGMRHFSRTTGCRLIAEGIETAEEAATLTGLGVEYGQGFLYGRPAPAASWAEPAGPGRAHPASRRRVPGTRKRTGRRSS